MKIISRPSTDMKKPAQIREVSINEGYFSGIGDNELDDSSESPLDNVVNGPEDPKKFKDEYPHSMFIILQTHYANEIKEFAQHINECLVKPLPLLIDSSRALGLIDYKTTIRMNTGSYTKGCYVLENKYEYDEYELDDERVQTFFDEHLKNAPKQSSVKFKTTFELCVYFKEPDKKIFKDNESDIADDDLQKEFKDDLRKIKALAGIYEKIHNISQKYCQKVVRSGCVIDSNISSCVVGMNEIDSEEFLKRSLYFYIKKDGHDPSLNKVNVESVISEEFGKVAQKLNDEIARRNIPQLLMTSKNLSDVQKKVIIKSGATFELHGDRYHVIIPKGKSMDRYQMIIIDYFIKNLYNNPPLFCIDGALVISDSIDKSQMKFHQDAMNDIDYIDNLITKRVPFGTIEDYLMKTYVERLVIDYPRLGSNTAERPHQQAKLFKVLWKNPDVVIESNTHNIDIYTEKNGDEILTADRK